MFYINKRLAAKAEVTGRFINYSPFTRFTQSTDQKTKSPRGIDFLALVTCRILNPTNFKSLSRFTTIKRANR